LLGKNFKTKNNRKPLKRLRLQPSFH